MKPPESKNPPKSSSSVSTTPADNYNDILTGFKWKAYSWRMMAIVVATIAGGMNAMLKDRNITLGGLLFFIAGTLLYRCHNQAKVNAATWMRDHTGDGDAIKKGVNNAVTEAVNKYFAGFELRITKLEQLVASLLPTTVRPVQVGTDSAFSSPTLTPLTTPKSNPLVALVPIQATSPTGYEGRFRTSSVDLPNIARRVLTSSGTPTGEGRRH